MQENQLRQVAKRFPKLEKDIKTDVLIVGGGVTGILSAHSLEKAGYKTTIVEMDEVGSGASGASSGILYYGSGTNLVPAIKLWGIEKAHFIWKETAENIAKLIEFIEKNNIDCGLRKLDGLMAAKTKDEMKLIIDEKVELEKVGLKHNILTEKEMNNFYTGQKFLSGLHFHNCAQIYPAILAAGVAEKFNLNLFENTKMLSFENSGSGFFVKTSGGKIFCDKIIFATNDFPIPPEKSIGLENFFKQESSMIIASQKLEPNQIKKFYPQESAIWTMDENYDIVYTHENRLILEVYRLAGIKEKLASYYPEFDFNQDLQWGSSWGRASDWLPICGEFQKNIFTAMATGDQGTTIGYTIAKHIVDMVEGKKNKFLEMTNPKRFL